MTVRCRNNIRVYKTDETTNSGDARFYKTVVTTDSGDTRFYETLVTNDTGDERLCETAVTTNLGETHKIINYVYDKARNSRLTQTHSED